MSNVRIALVMEQTLGHRSHTQTLQWGVDEDPEIVAEWLPIHFDSAGLPWSLPLIRHNWSVRGSLRTRSSLMHLQEKPDALFIHTLTVSLLAGSYMARIPTVLSLDATPENYDQIGYWYRHRILPKPIEAMKRTLRARSVRKASAIVTWCYWAKDSLIEHYSVSPESIHVIPPGAALEWFPFGRSRQAKETESAIRLLFVGGDFHRKGGDVLLRAYRSAFRGRVEMDLVTEEDVKPEEGVRVFRGLTSNSPELLALYEQADIFVLPTLGDCFPVVLGEAMAAGLPIVTTDTGALTEAVKAGLNGLVIPPGDDVALVSALSILVENEELRLRMGHAGRRLAEENFDSHRNATRVLDVIKGVCRPADADARLEPEPASV
jgi:glycosyltransferase involved in cell wall biosynthesis